VKRFLSLFAQRKLLDSLSGADSAPPSGLQTSIRNVTVANMNIKAFGYDLARRLAAALPVPTDTQARHVGLSSKASVQADIESDWVAHWCGQLGIPVFYHRKLWELSYVLQAIHENGLLRDGVRALGFGCGTESTPSYLAAHGVAVTVTDLADTEAQSQGWAATNQHASSLDQAFHPHLVDRQRFDALVTHRYVDMTAIDPDLVDYDICWSICALEHLGSIARGWTSSRSPNSISTWATSRWTCSSTCRPGGRSCRPRWKRCMASPPT
jgi:hypothetical protein